jgi:hypothetical protein
LGVAPACEVARLHRVAVTHRDYRGTDEGEGIGTCEHVARPLGHVAVDVPDCQAATLAATRVALVMTVQQAAPFSDASVRALGDGLTVREYGGRVVFVAHGCSSLRRSRCPPTTEDRGPVC